MLSIHIVLIPILISFVLGSVIVPKTKITDSKKKNLFGFVRTANRTDTRAKAMGGIAFVPVILMSLGVTVIVNLRAHALIGNDALADEIVRLFNLVAGMTALYVIGLKDDLHGTDIWIRIFMLIFAAILFPMSGLWICNLHGLLGLNNVSAWVGMPLTVLLVIYLPIVITLIDDINGLASGLSCISLLLLTVLSFYLGTYVPCIVSCVGLGTVLPFWFPKFWGRVKHNRVFMGASGAMPLGYLIAFVIIYLSRSKGLGYLPTSGLFLLALSTVFLPVMDIVRVLASRYRDGRPMLTPDRNQIHHKLVRAGFKSVSIIISIFFLSLAFFSITLTGIISNLDLNIILFFNVLIYIATQFGINYLIKKQKSSRFASIWEKHYGSKMWDEVKEEKHPENLQEAARFILENTRAQKKKMETAAPIMTDIAFIPDGMNSFERNIKRLVDMFVAGVCLIIFSPLFLLSFCLIKFDDGGPAIFRQERIGRFGRPFYIYKFRSMRLDAEKLGPQLSHSGGDDDPRLTKIGRFLRAHHLDELPQLWNVFIGDMAFIGYRPERKFYIDQILRYDPRYTMLYQIRPGVTSYATLYNGYTDTMEKMLRRLELDLYYLRHRSWLFDFKILWLTFSNIVFGKKF